MVDLVVFNEANLRLWFTAGQAADGLFDVTALHAKASPDQSLDLTFAQSVKLVLPEQLFSTDGDNRTLKSAAALKAEAQLIADEMQAAASAALKEEKARRLEKLRESLSVARQIDMALDASGDIFGITGIAGATSLTARASLDLSHLLPTDTFDDPPSPRTLALSVVLDADAQAKVGALNADVSVHVEIALDLALAEFHCDFGLDLPRLPRLPPLRLKLPHFTLPKWRFGAIALPRLRAEWLRFLRLDLHVPLDVEISNDPQMSIDVSQGKLTIGTTTPVDGRLTCKDDANNNVEILGFTGVGISVPSGGAISFTGILQTPKLSPPKVTIPPRDIDAAFLPFTIRIAAATVTIGAGAAASFDLAAGTGELSAKNVVDFPRIELRSKADPSLTIALAATYEVDLSTRGGEHGKLTRLEILTPYPLALIARAGKEVIAGILRLASMIKLPDAPDGPDFPPMPNPAPLLEHLGAFLLSCVRWLARQAGGAANALFGLVEAALEAVGRMLEAVRHAASEAVSHVVVEVRLDADSLALRQIVITPLHRDGAATAAKKDIVFAGFTLTLPGDARPSLVVDLSEPRAVVALVVTPTSDWATLSTDLWLNRTSGTEAVRDKADKAQTDKDKRPLLAVDVKNPNPIALVALAGEKPRFFQELVVDGPLDETEVVSGRQYRMMLLKGRPRFSSIKFAGALNVSLNTDKVARLLPFLSSPTKESAGDDSIFKGLGQFIRIKHEQNEATIDGRVAKVPIDVQIVVGGDDKSGIETTLQVVLDIETLESRIEGGRTITIQGTDAPRDLLGLQLQIKSLDPQVGHNPFPQFVLDFSGGDARMALAPDAIAELSYTRVASRGRGILFKVDQFAITREGIDLDATVNADEPVQLAGVDMPFRFSRGQLSIKRGEVQSFCIDGAGQLPPALVGEANAKISIAMGRDGSGRLRVQAADAELEKAGSPLVCKTTRFTFSISKLGLSFHDFGPDGTHFFFLLTGTARFTPGSGEFSSGLLKYLPDLTITLDKAPLAGDPRMLLRRMSFQVAVTPPRRIKFFELFDFELRGIGFHPSSDLFGGKPALSISGQVSFIEAGDAISTTIDFHQLWIAPPKNREALPQVRFDGLTVALGLGGVGSVEGTAITVDGQMPTLYKPDILPSDVTARGFLASGRLNITGWAPLSAAMGFLEMEKAGGDLRHAFFLYGQLNRLSVTIPTPIGSLYLREAGFGFGFRYTLAALAQADQVTDPKALVKVLDSVSRYQGELANVRAWQPEPDGDRVTLAMRAMFSMSSLSKSGQLDEREEKLPNPVLFDATVALRSDLTLLMTARAWIAVNYWTWDHSISTAPLRDHPSLRGYMYVSVPRQEFLARLVASRDGIIGDTPPLHPALKMMLQAVDWSSTLFIRPGLFHQEFGWPYELGFALKDDNGNFGVDCRGGMILRIEDGAVLQGVAFRASGFAQFGGSVGGGSLGASVYARADFAIDAKFISYISLKRIDETLFYGSLAFSITLRVSVRVWLDLGSGPFHIHLEVGFSASFCLTVALELAASPQGLAGRGAAHLSVSAFGRSLGLGIGFGFNEGMLQGARGRVDRFLSLGLASSVPDPAAGLTPTPPPLVQAPQQAAADADQASQDAMRAHDTLNDGPQDDSGLVEIGQSRFWAMIRPAVLADGYVMTLIPRDRTHHASEGLPTLSDGDGATYFGDSEFYAPDRTVYEFALESTRATLWHLMPTAAAPLAAGPTNIRADYARVVVQGDDPTKSASLADIVAQCFVRDRLGNLRQLKSPLRTNAAKQRLPQDADKANAELRKAAERLASAPDRVQEMIAAEQRRSSLVAAVNDSVADIAARIVIVNGIPTAPPPPESVPGRTPVIDARDFGLTFFVSRTDIHELFEPEAQPNPEKGFLPGRSKFTVRSMDAPGVAGVAYLLNPPERFFANKSPALAGAKVAAEADAIRLDWDLEPWHARSRGVYDDPEFHLVHYRVARTIVADGAVLANFPARPVTVKAAAPLHLIGDSWTPIRPAAQYTDRLDDMPEASRRALLGSGDNPAEDWTKSFAADKIVLTYTVVPVDLAGTAGTTRILTLEIRKPAAQTKPLASAQIVFTYPALPALGESSINPSVLLSIVDPQPIVSDPTYTLRLRRERGIFGGLYGADSVTEGMQRPQPSSFAKKFTDDQDYVVTLKGSLKALSAGSDPIEILDRDPGGGRAWYQLRDKKVADLQAELLKGAAGRDPYSRRIGVLRGRYVEGVKSPAWCVADLAVSIKAAPKQGQSQESPAALVSVETFEHPVRISFDALHFDDLNGLAGRVRILHPTCGGTIQDLIQGDGAALLRDQKRRVGARLIWNARPSRGTGNAGLTQASERPGFVGGFDVFSIDRTSLLTAERSAAEARRVARVQALPARMRAIDPAQIDDFGAIESYYPSLTARMTFPGADQHAQRRSADGLRPWFSPAESLLAWPKWGVRRSLGLDFEEADLTPLFAKGTPTAFRFELDRPDGLPALKLIGDAGFVGVVKLQDGDKPQSRLRQALRALVFDRGGCSDVDERIRTARAATPLPDAAPDPLKSVRLKITSFRENREQGTAFVPLDLLPVVHPVIADVIDWMRWAGDAAGEVPHRRFTPVIDAPPQTKAKTIGAFLDERPEPRDPYGWAVLRTFGLATGFKLFDMERADYCSPKETLTKLRKALEAILPRYEGLWLGAPFVDVLSRPDGLIWLESFDGNTRSNAPEASTMLEDEALSLVQVALRPVPEIMTGAPEDVLAVRYFRIADSAGSTISIDLDRLDAPAAIITRSPSVLVEVIDLTTGLAASRPTALARKNDYVARYLLSRNKPAGAKLAIKQRGQSAAFVRVVALPPDGAPVDLEALLRSCIEVTKPGSESAAPNGVAPDHVVVAIDQPRATRNDVLDQEREPFGAFDPLSAGCVKALIFGTSLEDIEARRDPQDNPPAEDQVKYPPHSVAVCYYNALVAAAKPQFADGWPTPTAAATAQLNFAERVVTLSRRFLAHGPVGPARVDATPFSLTSLLRVDPWRVAPTPDGQMEITLLFEDRYALRQRYVVRPFGRYENLDAALAQPAEGVAKAFGRQPVLTDIADNDAAFSARSLDIVVPRTHPIDPPVILSTGRLDSWANPDEVGSGAVAPIRKLGAVQEIVLSRHPEEILSEANFDVADRLSFAHVGVGFLRGFASVAWGTLFARDAVDLEEGFGDGMIGSVPALSFEADSFSKDAAVGESQTHFSLAERIPDGWRGLTALRIRQTPHAISLHAVAYAAAGVVVSSPVAAPVAQSRYTLAFPWGRGAPLPLDEPAWSVNDARMIELVIPLVRYLDGMFPEDRRDWFGNGDPPRLFKLPDYDVSFALELARAISAQGAGSIPSAPRSVATEIELAPKLIDRATDPSYAARAKGSRFQVEKSKVELDPSAKGWTLKLEIARQPLAPVKPPSGLLSPGDYDGLKELEIAALKWAAWKPLAPMSLANVTIRRPDDVPAPGQIDWAPFRTETGAAADFYLAYTGSPEAQTLAADLQRFRNVASLSDWLALEPNSNEHSSAVPALPYGLPCPGGTLLPAATFLRIKLDETKRTPPPVPVDTDGASRGNRSVLGQDPAGSIYRKALRRLDMGARAAIEAQPSASTHYAALSFALPNYDSPAEMAQAALALAGATLPDSLSVLIETDIDAHEWTGTGDPDAGALADLIDALEAKSGANGRLRKGVGDATAVLASLADRGKADVRLTLPHRLTADPSIATELQAFRSSVGDGGEPRQRAAGLVLHEPPSQTELAAIRRACDDLAAAKPALRRAVERLRLEIEARAHEQLFGPDRELQWSAFHGFADPVHQILARKS
ncbi:hypothetical protein ABIF38_008792 [Bradyrhizobium japonicum]|uniref:hypothetical protein n=1 Tax=Bradyrhizobium elkanii TaxID=29448 RepID=UPI00036E935A|nr:hypothetical protein [Bradyrhizobium elkanii]MCP1728891.1 hypothetical protein [Bradyrhizobium elkanii]MCS3452317.1 hypothetical protein [Bradyrhizobium elkanii]MCS3565580.1 hypothetical protein [Bradyrhizobium elkanii]MCS3573016.1 hypothetical protein [Bradyrhizobium elkanii]MCS3594291.1 hypothetical protein [Bradyrhizobium elkanii]